MSSTTTTPSTWLNFMWTLHNKVRNGRGVKLTGLGALNEINNFLLLFFIERNFDKYENLDDTCRFSYIYDNFCSPRAIKEDEELENKSKKPLELPLHKRLFIHYSDASNMQCVLRKLLSDPDIKSYLKNEVTAISAYTESVETGKTIQDIIIYIHDHFESIAKNKKKSIDKLTLDDFGFDAFGDAYEKFKQQSCEDSGKTTGQHFTPDLVKDYIINELAPKDNEIFYEPACGTGGFIHKSMKYIKNKGGNYKKFCSKLFANECNPEIYKPLAINMLIHDIPIDNICKKDSLNINHGHKMKNRIDICATNPPFGGGDTVDSDSEYWGPLQTGKNIIKDAMAQFIMHIYQSLKVGGRCGTVSDRGIINNGSDGKNSWQKKLRQFLLENTNLYRIVLLPRETFDYTSFATCVLFFKKGEKTKEVEFRELKFKETITEGKKTYIIDPESDKAVVKVPIDKIKEKNYSLKLDDYIDKSDEKKKDNEKWIELKNIINLIKINHKDSSVVDENGKYIYYSSSIIDYQKTNEYTNDDECLVINKTNGSGKSKIFYNNKTKFCASSATIIFKFNKNFNIKFGYYYMTINLYEIEKLYTGGDKKSLNISNFEKLLLPNIPIDHQEEIVKFLDEQFTNYDINKIKKETSLFDLLTRKEYQLAEDLIYMIYREIDMREQVEKIKKDRNSILNLSTLQFQTKKLKISKLCDINPSRKNDYKFINYIEISSIKDFKIVSLEKINDNFPSRAKRVIEKNDIIISNVRPNLKNICLIDIDKENLIASTAFVVLKTNKKVLNKYLFEYLKRNDVTDYLLKKCTGDSPPSFNLNVIENLIINIPSLEDQKKIIKKLDDFDKKTEPIIKYSEELTKDLETWMEGIKKYCEQEIEEDETYSKSDSDNTSTKSNKSTSSDDNTNSKLTKKQNDNELDDTAKLEQELFEHEIIQNKSDKSKVLLEDDILENTKNSSKSRSSKRNKD